METTKSTCRLCGANTVEQFRLEVLRKYDVGFRRCDQCESLQTEVAPFWLDEAYADQRRFFDTGAVERNQMLQALAWYIRWAFRLRKATTALDWGGSNGLFTRMLRDIGFDAFHYDKYALNTYAAGFEDEDNREYDIVTAFEVYEHFPEPGDSIEAIFSRKPLVHFLMTSLYRGQGKDWDYIWPSTGRHVFFFSKKAMQQIADKYGYSLLQVGSYTIFHRIPLLGFRRRLLSRVLSGGKQGRLFQAIFAVFRPHGFSNADRTLMMKRKQPI